VFVLADALHHASMQAEALVPPIRSRGLRWRRRPAAVRAAFPDSSGYDETDRGKALNRGVEAAHAVMSRFSRNFPQVSRGKSAT